MKIVSNTGPLIGLAKIDQIFLLKRIAEAVFIPPMVHRELLGKVGLESDRIDKALDEFISVRAPKPLRPEIEAAIADLDEKVAERLNIPITGLVGLLLLAKEKGLVANVVPLLEELQNNGYWLSDEVIEVARSLLKNDEEVKEAIEAHLEALKREGEEIPQDEEVILSRVRVPMT